MVPPLWAGELGINENIRDFAWILNNFFIKPLHLRTKNHKIHGFCFHKFIVQLKAMEAIWLLEVQLKV